MTIWNRNYIDLVEGIVEIVCGDVGAVYIVMAPFWHFSAHADGERRGATKDPRVAYWLWHISYGILDMAEGLQRIRG